jgi:hypothetical protein
VVVLVWGFGFSLDFLQNYVATVILVISAIAKNALV